MKFGIQRRGIYLCPLVGLDRHWIFKHLESEEIQENLGVGDGDPRMLRVEHSLGRIIVGTIRRVRDRLRIGFVALRAPAGQQDFWDFSYAIPDGRHRDAFSAIATVDAITHYMLDHVGVEAVGGLTLEDNLAAQMVVRRVGHRVVGTREYFGRRWTVYRFGKEEWTRRFARLQRGEELRPSGIGGVFGVLKEPPFDPIVPMGRDEVAED